jgi:hypothetical protein
MLNGEPVEVLRTVDVNFNSTAASSSFSTGDVQDFRLRELFAQKRRTQQAGGPQKSASRPAQPTGYRLPQDRQV